VSVALLKLSPADFWAMTLPELGAALEAWREANGAVPRALSRGEVERLRAEYPD